MEQWACVLPRRSENNDERIACRLLPHRRFLFDSSLVFSGEGKKKEKKKKTTSADIDDLLSSLFPFDDKG